MADIIKYFTAIVIIFLWLYTFVYCGLWLVSHFLSWIVEMMVSVFESVRDFIKWHR